MALCLVLRSFASACLAAADMLPAHEEECIVDIVWTISHWGVPLWWLEDAAGADGAAAGVAAPQEVPAAGAGGAVSPAAAEDAASAEAPPPPAAAAAYPYGSPRPMSLIARKLVRQLQQQQLTPEAAAEVGGTKVGCIMVSCWEFWWGKGGLCGTMP